jgi:large subunit ribosomal protein L18
MQQNKRVRRLRRHRRVRRKVFGTADRPRLVVFRSLRHIYAQLIDDEAGRTLVAAASTSGRVKKMLGEATGKSAESRAVGRAIAEEAHAKGHRRVVFDRGGYAYHGRVKVLAEAARESGLEF